MIKRILCFMFVLLFVAALSGCYRTQVQARSGNVSMSPPRGRVIADFEEAKRQPFLIAGLVPIGDDSVDISAMARGRNLAGVEVKTYFSFVDILLSLVTFNIYSPNTVVISGKVVE